VSTCPRCAELHEEIEKLKEQNSKLSDALVGTLRRSNTDLILGAALSGGDALELAKRLANTDRTPKVGA